MPLHTTYLCTDSRFAAHVPPGEHPERPERLTAIDAVLRPGSGHSLGGLAGRCRALPARPATREELLRVHTERYLHALSDQMREDRRYESGWLDPDTYFSQGTWEAAHLAAGASVDLALRVLEGSADNGMALVRPPGHHATSDRAMGFCLLNNVAVAAAAARARGARVAIVDIDVHHGNGTEEIFAADPDVLFISLHQYPFYPGTGAAAFTGTGQGQGATVNIPLPQGCDDRIYRRCFGRVVLPVLSRFAPDLILVSAGYDAHRRDPLAGMALTEEGFGDLFARLLTVQPRLAAVLEGGYHLEALGLSVAASIAALLDGPGGAGAGAGEKAQEGHGQRALDALGEEVEATLGLLRRLHQIG